MKRTIGEALLVVGALLLVATSGAVAAATITGRQIENGTITGRDVKSRSLTGKHIKNRTIKSRDVKNGAIKGRDVKNRSLTPADFRGSVRGPAGPQGSAGPVGPAGPAGPSGSTVIFDAIAPASGLPAFDTGAGGIPGGFTKLEIEFLGRTNRADVYDRAVLSFNGDEAVGSYMWVDAYAWQGGTGSDDHQTDFDGQPSRVTTGLLAGYASAARAEPEALAGFSASVYRYGENLRHAVRSQTMYHDAFASPAIGPEVKVMSGFWKPPRAIHRLVLKPHVGTRFVAGSRLTVWVS